MGRRLTFEMAAAVVLGALLGVGLHAFGVGDTTTTGASEALVEVAGISVERAGSAATSLGVLRADAGGCGDVRQASATVVRHGGRTVVLTNAHVVRGSGTVTLQGPDGRILTAQVVGSVPGRDAAVLELTGEDTASLPVAPTGPMPAVGDVLAVAGHPDGMASVGPGRLVSIDRRAGFGGASDVMVLDRQVRGGSSGGAVLDDQGNVVGLVAAKDPVTGGAVAYPIAEVLDRGLGPVPGC